MTDCCRLPIAIQPDLLVYPDGKRESYSDLWIAHAKDLAVPVEIVDVFEEGFLDRVRRCGAFLWRFPHAPNIRQYAKRLLPAIEHGLGMPVYPDWRTCWHYDDKVAQTYLLQGAGIPIPPTHVFWSRDKALEYVSRATFPLVLKLGGGAASQNVRLVRDVAEAQRWIGQLFSSGAFDLDDVPALRQRVVRSGKDALRLLLRGRPPAPAFWYDFHKNYVLFQEFLSDNPFDTRIAVFGSHAFGMRRFNREGDFRASGSGRLDLQADAIDPRFVRLAFDVATVLNMQTVAVDGLYDNEHQPVISEISYTCPLFAISACPGHWERGEGQEALRWVEGRVCPADIILNDMLGRIAGRTS